MTPAYHVLFLCTGNCCRSQMAEAILTHLGPDRFVAHSAGSSPAGFVHPLVEDALTLLGIPLHERARSKSWNEFENQRLDLVITVCDFAADLCPAWTRRSLVAHWPLPDPSFLPGTDEQRLEAAVRVAERLRLKIERLIALDFDHADEASLASQLEMIGQL